LRSVHVAYVCVWNVTCSRAFCSRIQQTARTARGTRSRELLRSGFRTCSLYILNEWSGDNGVLRMSDAHPRQRWWQHKDDMISYVQGRYRTNVFLGEPRYHSLEVVTDTIFIVLLRGKEIILSEPK